MNAKVFEVAARADVKSISKGDPIPCLNKCSGGSLPERWVAIYADANDNTPPNPFRFSHCKTPATSGNYCKGLRDCYAYDPNASPIL